MTAGLLLLLLSASPAWSQRPEVRVGLLTLEAEPGAEPALRRLSAAAPEILARVESQLGIRPARRYRIVLVPPGGPRDPEWIRIDDEAPPWAAAYMIPARRIGAIRIAQAARYPYGTLESTLAHEATHQLLHDAVAGRIPLWFNEGVSTFQGRRWSLDDMFVYTTSLVTGHLPALSELNEYFQGSASQAQLAYAASFAFVSWSVNRHGESLMREVIEAARTRPFEEAWRAVTGIPLADAERVWRRGTLLRYRWLPLLGASSTLWLGITLLAIAAGVRKRARVRKLREQWEREEREPVPDDLAGAEDLAPGDDPGPRPPPT